MFNAYAGGAKADFLKNGNPQLISAKEYNEWTAKSIRQAMMADVVALDGEFPGSYISTDKGELAKTKRTMRRRLLSKDEDNDPMSVVSNLFDVAMVFAVALMVALVSRYNMTEMFSKEDFTMVKNPGKENMEIIIKEGDKINRFTPSEDQDSKNGKRGKKIGVAYELENGEIIYVPD